MLDLPVAGRSLRLVAANFEQNNVRGASMLARNLSAVVRRSPQSATAKSVISRGGIPAFALTAALAATPVPFPDSAIPGSLELQQALSPAATLQPRPPPHQTPQAGLAP